MRQALLVYEEIDGIIKKLPQMMQSVSDQLSPLALLFSACLEPVENEEDLKARMVIIDELYSYADDTEHVAAKFADFVTDRIYEYETKNRNVPNVSPREALAFFMKERGIRQADLCDIATQSVISEILHGKRSMTIQQVKGFAKFFGVPVETFMGTL
ncbi:helix-turn-helix domain-containing protein [Xenorhabdus bovienii]|uniref:helix-turn-helix domain-containing protein n=1 Tax=Xenorhabdus bovienii TaxID=40576 RepID=UPI003DA321FE